MLSPRSMKEGKRPSPTIEEIFEMDDEVLHDFWDYYKSSISRSIEMNISIEDDHVNTLLWRSICARFHKLKELEEAENLLRAHGKKVLQLRKELCADDEGVVAVPNSFCSQNFSVLSNKEVQPQKQFKRKPTAEDFNKVHDQAFQKLWSALKRSICEAERNKICPSKDHHSSLLLKRVHEKYHALKSLKQKTHTTASQTIEPVVCVFSTFGEEDLETPLICPSMSLDHQQKEEELCHVGNMKPNTVSPCMEVEGKEGSSISSLRKELSIEQENLYTPMGSLKGSNVDLQSNTRSQLDNLQKSEVNNLTHDNSELQKGEPLTCLSEGGILKPMDSSACNTQEEILISDFSSECQRSNIVDIAAVDNQLGNNDGEIVWGSVNSLYTTIEYIEDFVVQDNPLFIPYDLCDRDKPKEGHLENHGGMTMLQPSKKVEVHPKYNNHLEASSSNHPRLLEATKENLIYNFQKITKVHDGNHKSIFEVKNSLSLMPLTSEIKDPNTSFVWPNVDQNVLIVLIDDIEPNVFEFEEEVEYEVFLFDFTPTQEEWSQPQILEAFYFENKVVDVLA